MIFNWLSALFCIVVMSLMCWGFHCSKDNTFLFLMWLVFVFNVPNFIVLALNWKK